MISAHNWHKICHLILIAMLMKWLHYIAFIWWQQCNVTT